MRALVQPRRRHLCLLAWLATFTACLGTPTPEFPGGPLSVSLATDAGTGRAIIRVTGWSSEELRGIRRAGLSAVAWNDIVHVSLPATADIAVAGTHRITADAVEMVPQYPLDRGREYLVRVSPERLPAPPSGHSARNSIEARVSLPDSPGAATTRVTAIYPSSPVWPENILRFYLHFSAPMSGTSAVGHVRLVDDHDVEVRDALLEVDVDLWDGAYTRRTVFFDPGRVKRGIKPNVELGRALVAGRRYAIVVGTTWKDAHGQPLAEPFRHAFTAGPAIESAIEPSAWVIAPPTRATLDPLVVRFPRALDEALLHRALGVASASGESINGETAVGPDQTSWTFTPAAPWRDAPHALVVLTVLEDPAGNKVGQAFEFEMQKPSRTPEPERLTLPFRPR